MADEYALCPSCGSAGLDEANHWDDCHYECCWDEAILLNDLRTVISWALHVGGKPRPVLEAVGRLTKECWPVRGEGSFGGAEWAADPAHVDGDGCG